MTLRAMMLHGIVVIDALLVAPLGEDALAAMGLAAALGGLLAGMLLAFSNATQIIVAQAFGSGRPVALKTAFYCGVLVNVAAAVVGLTVVGLFAQQIIDGSAPTEWIAGQALHYLTVFSIVVLAEAFGQSLSGHFNGCGETKLPFYSYLVAVPVNVVVSLILIHGLFGAPAMGVTGAAVGSAMASILRAAYLMHRFYAKNRDVLAVEGWLHGTLWASFRKHVLFALPIAATFISAHLANTVCTLIYARLSINAFAAMTLIIPWVQVAGTVGMSWAQAVGIIMGQLLGRNQPGDDLDAFLRTAMRGAYVAATLVALTYLGVCLASGWVYADLQAETRAALLGFLPVLLFLPFPKGSNAVCGNTLRAGGETVYVMNIFVWSQWLFRVPMTALFVLYLDLSVVWVLSLLLFEELVKFPAFHLAVLRGRWKRDFFAE